MELLVAKPRGFCAGVERAVRVVELALERFGAPVYVRKEIVHNSHVVARLRERGAVFVDELDTIPTGAIAILSAHGSAPAVYQHAAQRGLRLIDATCPLVTKVHKEVHRYVQRGYRILLIGHAGHDEVVGTMGQAPGCVTLIETIADVQALSLGAGQPGVILTQTTLSQDDTQDLVEALRARFPQLELPPNDDICYATQNRQNAVKQMASDIQLLIVVGSPNSSNSLRLTDVSRRRGVPAHLVDRPEQVDPAWLRGVTRVGVTSGASAPEDVTQAVLARLRELGAAGLRELPAEDERVVFSLPPFTSLEHPVGGVAP